MMYARKDFHSPKGFTLLELVIVIALSTFMFTILYRSITSVQRNFSSCIVRSEKLALDVPVYQLIGMDCGAILPFPPFEPEPEKKKESAPAQQPGQNPSAAQPQSSVDKKEKKEEKKRVISLLMELAGDKTAYITMLTNNRFPSYVAQERYPVRVIYQLQQPTNLLVRYESDDITTPIKSGKDVQSFIAQKKLKPIVLYDKVTAWRIEALVEQEDQKKGEQMVLPSWGTDEARKATKRTVPDALRWHMEYSVMGSADVLDLTLPIYGVDQIEEEKSQKSAPGEQSQKSKTSAQQNPGGPAGARPSGVMGRPQSGKGGPYADT